MAIISIPRPPILRGANIVLRLPRPDDVDARLILGDPPEIVEMFGVSPGKVRPLQREDAERWVEGLKAHPYAWIIEKESCIGEIRLDHVDRRDRRASMSVGIYDLNKLSKGLGSEAIMLVLDYAFSELKLHRIAVRVLAYNKRAIRAYEKCGFIIEGRERETAFVNDTWHDDLIMGLLESEFRANRV